MLVSKGAKCFEEALVVLNPRAILEFAASRQKKGRASRHRSRMQGGHEMPNSARSERTLLGYLSHRLQKASADNLATVEAICHDSGLLESVPHNDQ